MYTEYYIILCLSMKINRVWWGVSGGKLLAWLECIVWTTDSGSASFIAGRPFITGRSLRTGRIGSWLRVLITGATTPSQYVFLNMTPLTAVFMIRVNCFTRGRWWCRRDLRSDITADCTTTTSTTSGGHHGYSGCGLGDSGGGSCQNWNWNETSSGTGIGWFWRGFWTWAIVQEAFFVLFIKRSVVRWLGWTWFCCFIALRVSGGISLECLNASVNGCEQLLNVLTCTLE